MTSIMNNIKELTLFIVFVDMNGDDLRVENSNVRKARIVTSTGSNHAKTHRSKNNMLDTRFGSTRMNDLWWRKHIKQNATWFLSLISVFLLPMVYSPSIVEVHCTTSNHVSRKNLNTAGLCPEHVQKKVQYFSSKLTK
jgi:hypothetical protein